MLTTISARRGRGALLRVPRRIWRGTLSELRERGGGVRESGAFLLADRAGDWRTVRQVVYFDDLDPTCLVGAIKLAGVAYSELWDICDAVRRVVIADVHTHPGASVRQSHIDAANPMIARPGHLALIVPRFAQGHVRTEQVGVHRYDGNTWQTWTGAGAGERLFVGRFL